MEPRKSGEEDETGKHIGVGPSRPDGISAAGALQERASVGDP